MTDANPLIAELQESHRAYETALGQVGLAKRRRDTAVLAATDAGMSRAQIATVLGVDRTRVQQLVDRARRG